MATNNSVKSVLVTYGNQAVLAAGNKVTDLLPGQIGVFSLETGLSINAATSANNKKNVYIAVGEAINGSLTTNNVIKSAGQYIQVSNVRNYTARCYEPSVNKVVEITNFKPKCETEYAVRFDLFNQQIFRDFGFNKLSKTFTIMTGCCDNTVCSTCLTEDNDMVKQMVTEINNDPDKLMVAEYINYTTTPGTSTVVAPSGVDAWITANPTSVLGIRVTGVSESIIAYTGINPKYLFPRGLDFSINLVTGFECNGVVTVKQPIVYEEGAGYDIKQLEFEANGHNGEGSPYRLSQLAGMELNPTPTYAVQTGKYVTISLEYDLESVSGWGEYKNNLNTFIAIPCGETTTSAGLLAVLDTVFGDLGALADDIAACPSCTTVNLTEAKTAETDGITE